MSIEIHRHSISDKGWENIKPHTIVENGTRGGNAKNTWQFINGVFWILRTGAPWRDLLADRGYNNNHIIKFSSHLGTECVIPPKKNRKIQRKYDKYLYKLRYLIENAFLRLKRWRGIATRYDKNTTYFISAVQIRCISLCLNILV